ncbi:phage integrase N-terminal SAM-like domain-containing protein [Candidatus Microgenomates bacterium]|nr:phage integrase N-terminal SAM-like domain-containing protein [Candidatus Microgenomates bacterium]
MPNLLDIIKQEMELRNYSRKTISTYCGTIKNLYAFYRKSLRELTTQDIK